MIGRFICGALMTLSITGLPAQVVNAAAAGSLQVTPLGAQLHGAGNGTMVLRGSLPSTVGLTMRGAFSVGHARNLNWDLTRITDMAAGGYREAVESQTYQFNVAPNSFQDLTVNGMAVRRFHWDQPPANTVITVTERLTLGVQSGLSQFRGTVAYPLASVPAEAQPYQSITPSLHLSTAQRSLVRRLVRHQTSEQGVVRTVANWVASNVHYDAALVGGPYAASWVMTHHRATCQGYSSVMAGMLRSLGIPSQVVYGWVSAAPIRVKTGHTTQTIQWATPGTAGTLHDWLNVYFPGTGWVAFDPQMEKFFVDARHYAILTEVDAHDPVMGQWTANMPAGQSATGRPLADGTTEAVPGDGSYPTSITIHDAFRFHVASVVRDVNSVTLFSR